MRRLLRARHWGRLPFIAVAFPCSGVLGWLALHPPASPSLLPVLVLCAVFFVPLATALIRRSRHADVWPVVWAAPLACFALVVLLTPLRLGGIETWVIWAALWGATLVCLVALPGKSRSPKTGENTIVL